MFDPNTNTYSVPKTIDTIALELKKLDATLSDDQSTIYKNKDGQMVYKVIDDNEYICYFYNPNGTLESKVHIKGDTTRKCEYEYDENGLLTFEYCSFNATEVSCHKYEYHDNGKLACSTFIRKGIEPIVRKYDTFGNIIYGRAFGREVWREYKYDFTIDGVVVHPSGVLIKEWNSVGVTKTYDPYLEYTNKDEGPYKEMDNEAMWD